MQQCGQKFGRRKVLYRQVFSQNFTIIQAKLSDVERFEVTYDNFSTGKNYLTLKTTIFVLFTVSLNYLEDMKINRKSGQQSLLLCILGQRFVEYIFEIPLFDISISNRIFYYQIMSLIDYFTPTLFAGNHSLQIMIRRSTGQYPHEAEKLNKTQNTRVTKS